MEILSSCLIFAGALILAYCLYRYYGVLAFMRRQTYATDLFRDHSDLAVFCLLCLFLAGYVFIGVTLAVLEFRRLNVIIGLVLFLGALFVWVMVRTTRRMARAVARKTSEIIHAMVDSIDAKDRYTMGHSMHVMQLSALLYDALPPERKRGVDRDMLLDAALLHDIGKLRIPDRVLNKPGRLDEEEMFLMRKHPQYGAALLKGTSYGGIADWVLYHHERMDGGGYYALPAEQVPLEARILAVADTFSALYTDRVYHSRLDYPQAIAVLREAAGEQLDPELVAAFCTIDRRRIDAVTPPDTAGE